MYVYYFYLRNFYFHIIFHINRFFFQHMNGILKFTEFTEYLVVSTEYLNLVHPNTDTIRPQVRHGLESTTWHWGTKKAAKFETPDFKTMTNQSWGGFIYIYHILNLGNQIKIRNKYPELGPNRTNYICCLNNKIKKFTST